MIDYHNFTTKDTSKKERQRLGVGDIFSNSATCLICGDTIRSRNRHDYQTCSCGNLSVDGGSWYLRRGFKDQSTYKDTSEMYNEV